MNKKIIYIVCCLFALFMPISLVQAKTVEELIEEQNSSKLGTDNPVSMTCKYVVSSTERYGLAETYSEQLKPVTYKIKYNHDGKKNEISVDLPTGYQRQYVSSIDNSTFLSNNSIYYCPETIYVHVTQYEADRILAGGVDRIIYGNKWDYISAKPSENYAVLKLDYGKVHPLSVAGESIGSYYPGLIKIDYVCGGIVSDNLLKEIVKIYKTICLVTVAVVIILGILDFMKAISSDDDAALKKAASTFIKRITIVIILVILPIVLQFILTVFGDENMKQCLDKIK